MKEDSGPESKNGDVPGVSGLGPIANHQLSQVINRYNRYNFIKTESDLQPSKITFKEECVDLGVDTIDSEVINIDSTITKLVGKDALRYKVSAKVRYILNICRTISAASCLPRTSAYRYGSSLYEIFYLTDVAPFIYFAPFLLTLKNVICIRSFL